jgi:hypothetical protein
MRSVVQEDLVDPEEQEEEVVLEDQVVLEVLVDSVELEVAEDQRSWVPQAMAVQRLPVEILGLEEGVRLVGSAAGRSPVAEVAMGPMARAAESPSLAVRPQSIGQSWAMASDVATKQTAVTEERVVREDSEDSVDLEVVVALEETADLEVGEVEVETQVIRFFHVRVG